MLIVQYLWHYLKYQIILGSQFLKENVKMSKRLQKQEELLCYLIQTSPNKTCFDIKPSH